MKKILLLYLLIVKTIFLFSQGVKIDGEIFFYFTPRDSVMVPGEVRYSLDSIRLYENNSIYPIYVYPIQNECFIQIDSIELLYKTFRQLQTTSQFKCEDRYKQEGDIYNGIDKGLLIAFNISVNVIMLEQDPEKIILPPFWDFDTSTAEEVPNHYGLIKDYRVVSNSKVFIIFEEILNTSSFSKIQKKKYRLCKYKKGYFLYDLYE
mgnify:CR=1 FL=1